MPETGNTIPDGHDAGARRPASLALSRLDTAGFAHTPIGVFRKVERPSYDTLMAQQITEARTKQGEGNLAGLLAGGDTWQIR
jgi:2-oxoglutarate ferredoxin oxidoreductase subunit beta